MIISLYGCLGWWLLVQGPGGSKVNITQALLAAILLWGALMIVMMMILIPKILRGRECILLGRWYAFSFLSRRARVPWC